MLSPAMEQPPWRHAGRQLSISDARRVQAMAEAGYAKALRQHVSGETRHAHREAQLEQQIRDLELLGMRYQAQVDALKVEVNALGKALDEARQAQTSVAKLAFESAVREPVSARPGRPSTPPPPYSCSRSLDIPAASPAKALEVAKSATKAARREVSMRADKTPDGSELDTSATAAWIRGLKLDELLADALCTPLNNALSRGGVDPLSNDAKRVGQMAFVRALGSEGDFGIMAALLSEALEEIPRRMQHAALHAGLVYE